MRSNANLPFSLDEYRSRLSRVRNSMKLANLQGLMVHSPENIYYLTGYHSVGYFTYSALVISETDDAAVVIRDLIKDQVMATSWVENVQSWTDLQDPIQTTRNALEMLELTGKAVGFDQQAWFYNIGHHDALTKLCNTITFKEAAGLVEKTRLIKSPKEIEYIREAAKTCEAAMQGAAEAVKEGATENDVAAEAYYRSIKAGSEYLGHAMLVATGKRAGLGFTTWERTPIQKGDLLYLEMGGTYKRYNAAMSRGVVLGKPSDKARKLAESSREALERAMGAIKPGATSGDVDHAARSFVEKQGLAEYFRHRGGYLIGIGFPPDWGEGRIMSIIEKNQTALEPGMVFHLVPDLKVNSEMGVIYSDTVLVTQNGHEVLTNYPRDLIVK